VLPTFPAHVGVTGVLTLVKSGLSYTFGVNFQNVTEETNVSDMSKREVLVQDTDTGAFWRVKLSNLPTGQTDWSSIQNKPTEFPPSPHTHPVAEISDATVIGQDLVTAVDAAAARAAIGAVNKAGDAMTGPLSVSDTLFVDAADSSADAHLRLCDENGVSRGTVYWDRALDEMWLVLHDATGAPVNSIQLSATGATIGTSPIWTDANKQIADGQVLGNVSGSTGVPVGVTLSALLDKISNTHGAVLYRGASGWTALGAGAAGQVLTSGGAGADPSWQTPAGGGGGGSINEFRNVIINPLFDQNQRVVSGTVILSAGQYGHDRWKAGASGCTYTFSTSNGVTTITISAGSLQQVVEAIVFAGRGGTYFLTWQGTAQGRINGGSYGTSGAVSASLDGSANATVEFSAGTLALPQLELGAPGAFSGRHPAQEALLCRRYFHRVTGRRIFVTGSRNTFNVNGYIHEVFPVPMRVIPTMTYGAVSNTGAPFTVDVTTRFFTVGSQASSAGLAEMDGYTADAEI